MAKIPSSVIQKAIEKSEDADWVNSLSDKHELAHGIASNKHASSDSLHTIADAWSKTNIDHPNFPILTKAVHKMVGALLGTEGLNPDDIKASNNYETHKNLHPKTIKLIDRHLGSIDLKFIAKTLRKLADKNFELEARDRYYKLSNLRDHILGISDKLEELKKIKN